MEEILFSKCFEHGVSLVVQTPVRARCVFRERVVSEQRHSDGCVGITDNRVRQAVRIYFAPAHSFTGSRAAEATCVGPGIGDLKEIILTIFLDSQNFLNLRFCLEHEVFRPAPARAAKRRAELPRNRVMEVLRGAVNGEAAAAARDAAQLALLDHPEYPGLRDLRTTLKPAEEVKPEVDAFLAAHPGADQPGHADHEAYQRVAKQPRNVPAAERAKAVAEYLAGHPDLARCLAARDACSAALLRISTGAPRLAQELAHWVLGELAGAAYDARAARNAAKKGPQEGQSGMFTAELLVAHARPLEALGCWPLVRDSPALREAVCRAEREAARKAAGEAEAASVNGTTGVTGANGANGVNVVTDAEEPEEPAGADQGPAETHTFTTHMREICMRAWAGRGVVDSSKIRCGRPFLQLLSDVVEDMLTSLGRAYAARHAVAAELAAARGRHGAKSHADKSQEPRGAPRCRRTMQTGDLLEIVHMTLGGRRLPEELAGRLMALAVEEPEGAEPEPEAGETAVPSHVVPSHTVIGTHTAA